MYKIIRFYFDDNRKNRVIERGLTLEQAQAHCNDKETSSSTCTKPDALARTKAYGPWFDGYEKE
jgi:hypothetical protein